MSHKRIHKQEKTKQADPVVVAQDVLEEQIPTHNRILLLSQSKRMKNQANKSAVDQSQIPLVEVHLEEVPSELEYVNILVVGDSNAQQIYSMP